jgi:hypothetical protein
MKYAQRLNRYERKQQQQAKLAHDLHGEGLYIFENHNTSELRLPKEVTLLIPEHMKNHPSAPKKPIRSRRVPGKFCFVGYKYFMQFVRINMCRLVREVKSPSQIQEEKLMAEQKLITDQPDIYTEHGKVEHIQPAAPGKVAPKKLNEQVPPKQAQPDRLLVEDPCMDGIEIIRD